MCNKPIGEETRKRSGCMAKILKTIGLVAVILISLVVLVNLFFGEDDTKTTSSFSVSEISEPKDANSVHEEEISNAETHAVEEIKDIPGRYTTAEGYQIDIMAPIEEDIYPFIITFSLAEQNCVSGAMTPGEKVVFENNGYDSCDKGELTFQPEQGVLYLRYSGAINGDFYAQLNRKEVKDYSDYILDDYTGTYHSPTKSYEIEILATPSQGFWVNLYYDIAGVDDYGEAMPGVESVLENGTTVTIDINDDNAIHVIIISANRANGIFDENLIPGALGEVAEIHNAALLYSYDLSGETKFAHLCNIEQRCANLRVSDVTGQPDRFCDNEIYRFAGEVVQVGEDSILLKLCDRSDCENNLIVCQNVGGVEVGEKICVYGSGVGIGSYTRTYNDNTVREFETLLLEVGYTIRSSLEYGQTIPEYMENFICGQYSLKAGSTRYLLESDFTFNGSDINGRTLTISGVALVYSVTTATDMIGNCVSVQVRTETTSYRDEPCAITFYFKLNGTGMTYMGKRDSDTMAAMDYAQYNKVYE